MLRFGRVLGVGRVGLREREREGEGEDRMIVDVGGCGCGRGCDGRRGTRVERGSRRVTAVLGLNEYRTLKTMNSRA